MIKPFVAGQFYAADSESLKKQIEMCFASQKFGPGSLPGKRGNERLLGVISPHAGYQFSGPCQAWAYKAIAESKFPKRFIIIGPDHNGLFSSITTCKEDWETPFGAVKADTGFIVELMNKCKHIKKVDSIMEHSIEVQLPFLQYANKDSLRYLRIVPLVVPTDEHYMEIAEALAELGGEDSCVIVSSDFTHYGRAFRYTPFPASSVKEKMYEFDKKAISFIQKLNAKSFLNYTQETKATICGKNSIALGIEILKEWFAKKVDLLSYYTSGDLTNYLNAVGYAAVTFKPKAP